MKQYRFILILFIITISTLLLVFHKPYEASVLLLISLVIIIFIYEKIALKAKILGFADITFLNSLDDLVIILDNNNIILFLNKKAKRHLRTPIRGIFSKRMQDSILENNYNKIIFHPVLNRKCNKSRKEEIILTDETGRNFRAYIRVIRSIHNKVRVKIALIRRLDAGEYIQNELLKESKALIENKKQLEDLDLKTKDFLDYAAHEFKTPLTAIRLCTSIMLKNQKPDDKQVVEYCNMLRKESIQLEKIVNNIIELIRIDANQFKINKSITSLKTILERVETLFKEKMQQKNITLKLQVDNSLEKCFIDEERILQTFKNIVDNSIKNSSPNTAIIITATKIETRAHIIIESIGSPIPDELKESIFTKHFKSSSRQGAGIGLFITKKIIEAHNGKIWVDDNIDKETGKTIGTRFRVTIEIEDEKFKRIVNETDFC